MAAQQMSSTRRYSGRQSRPLDVPCDELGRAISGTVPGSISGSVAAVEDAVFEACVFCGVPRRRGYLQRLCGSPHPWRFQNEAERFYGKFWVQTTVAVLIGLSFLANIATKEMDPGNTLYPRLWPRIELFFNIIFALELAVNMYGTWFFRFWSRFWNIFDFFVVAIGLMDVFFDELPPQLTILRMMRAFRVFRLFAKIPSLRKVVLSLAHALPGMIQAGIINMLIMCIYAVVAVEFFGGNGDCARPDRHSLSGPASLTSIRGGCFATEYFGAFSKSMYSMTQVLTGESWSEVVVRPLLMSYDNVVEQVGVAIFFVSFIVLNSIVLLNVVVAVLLEKMSHFTYNEEHTSNYVCKKCAQARKNGELTEDHSANCVDFGSNEATQAAILAAEEGDVCADTEEADLKRRTSSAQRVAENPSCRRWETDAALQADLGYLQGELAVVSKSAAETKAGVRRMRVQLNRISELLADATTTRRTVRV